MKTNCLRFKLVKDLYIHISLDYLSNRHHNEIHEIQQDTRRIQCVFNETPTRKHVIINQSVAKFALSYINRIKISYMFNLAYN